MKKKSDNHKNLEQPDFFNQFPAEEQSDVQKIWHESSRQSPQPDIKQQEIDTAWNNLNLRIDRRTNSSTTNDSTWKWWAAAAVILLAAGTSYFLIPKTITVPYGEMVTTTLPDGSTVELNSGTRIQYSRLFGVINREVILNGEAFFSVKIGAQPFVVEGYQSAVKVTGTKFNVRSWKDDPGAMTEVSVVEGEVQFYKTDSDTQPVAIPSGYLSSVSDPMVRPSAPEKVQVERVTAWRSKQLMFNNRSLTVIFNDLERRFDAQIKLKNPKTGKQTLTAYYANPKNIESVLKDICRVKGLKYAASADGYRVYK